MFTKSVIKIEIAVLMVLFSSCAKQSALSQQPVNINLNLGGYTTVQNKFIDLILPKANASVASLKMCFKRLRFKLAESTEDSTKAPGSDDSVLGKSGSDDQVPHNSDPSISEDNIDFNIGEITVSSETTQLGSIKIPSGTYRRIEFDLENSCASGKSISLVNNFGTFSATDRITIKFDGHFEANIDGTLTLGVQQILNQLNNYNGTGPMKTTVESISGALSN